MNKHVLIISLAAAGFNSICLIILYLAAKTKIGTWFSTPEQCILFLVCCFYPTLLYLNYQFCIRFYYIYSNANESVWAPQFAVWAAKWATLSVALILGFVLFKQTPFVRTGDFIAILLYLAGAYISMNWTVPISETVLFRLFRGG